MNKFSAEAKSQAIARYLNGNESYRTIGESIDVDLKAIAKWVKQFEFNGVDAFIKQCTIYTQEFRLDVLNYMTEFGTSTIETAAIFNIPAPSTIIVWKKQIETHGVDALQSKKKRRSSMKKFEYTAKASTNIAKAYEYAKNKFVVLDDEELENLRKK